MKTQITAALIATFAMAGVANAASHSAAKVCDDATVAMVMEQVTSAGEANKAGAMMEFDMAKEAMAAGDNDKCSTHLTMASEKATAQ
ncbi:MAG: hypothetical protein WA921_05090 [Ahrensia sp.]